MKRTNMNTSLVKVTVVAAALYLATPGVTPAAEFLQLALWPPAQLVPATESIAGLRLNVYGRNDDVTGVDLGFAHEITHQFTGFSLGCASIVHGDARGVQLEWLFVRNHGGMSGWAHGFVTQVGEESKGLQTGLVCLADERLTGAQLSLAYNRVGENISGVQLAFVNCAANVDGLQIGLINLAENVRGLQIGFWNQIESKESWKVIPIVNWRF